MMASSQPTFSSPASLKGKKIIWLDPDVLRKSLKKKKVDKTHEKIPTLLSKELISKSTVVDPYLPQTVQTIEELECQEGQPNSNSVDAAQTVDSCEASTQFQNVPIVKIEPQDTVPSSLRSKRKSIPKKFFDDDNYSGTSDPVMKRYLIGQVKSPQKNQNSTGNEPMLTIPKVLSSSSSHANEGLSSQINLSHGDSPKICSSKDEISTLGVTPPRKRGRPKKVQSTTEKEVLLPADDVALLSHQVKDVSEGSKCEILASTSKKKRGRPSKNKPVNDGPQESCDNAVSLDMNESDYVQFYETTNVLYDSISDLSPIQTRRSKRITTKNSDRVDSQMSDDNLISDHEDAKNVIHSRKKRGRPRKSEVVEHGTAEDINDSDNPTPLRKGGTSQKMQKSVEVQTKEECLDCNDCGYTFKDAEDLKQHKTVHVKIPLVELINDRLVFKCDECQQLFDKIGDLRIHESDRHSLRRSNVPEHEESEHAANDDEDSVPMEHDLKSPKKTDREKIGSVKKKRTGRHSQVPIHQCPHCDKMFKRLYVMHYHINSKHNSEKTERKKREKKEKQEEFHCDKCKKNFCSFLNLERHLAIHERENSYICDVCGKKFHQKGSLEIHKRIHLGIKPYQCKTCLKQFTQLSGLRYHERTHVKNGNKRFSCDLCHKTYSSLTALGFHKNRHESRRPYMCDICGRRYFDPNSCRRHMRYHEGPAIECQYCHKMFYTRTNLLAHMHNHTGLKKFQCKECGTRLTSRAKLLEHRLIHQGVQPFPCPVCGRGFVQKSNMLTHVGKIHSLDPKRVRVTRIDKETDKIEAAIPKYKVEVCATVEEAQRGRDDHRGRRLNRTEDGDKLFSRDDQKSKEYVKKTFHVQRVKDKENANKNIMTFRIVPLPQTENDADVKGSDVEDLVSDVESVEQVQEVTEEQYVENKELVIEESQVLQATTETDVVADNVQYEEVILPLSFPQDFVYNSSLKQTFGSSAVREHKNIVHLPASYVTESGSNQFELVSDVAQTEEQVVFLEEVIDAPEKTIVYEEVVNSFPESVAQEEMVYTADNESGNAVVMLNGHFISRLSQ